MMQSYMLLYPIMIPPACSEEQARWCAWEQEGLWDGCLGNVPGVPAPYGDGGQHVT